MRAILTAASLAAYGVLTLAVLVCVALAGNALVHANDSLGVVDAELSSVTRHADPLAYQVHQVNASLTAIEKSLQPLHGQADNLNGILSGVSDSLKSSDAIVKDILAKAGAIEASLANADVALGLSPTGEAGEVGPNRATARVAMAQDQAAALIALLGPIEHDLSGTEAQLTITNDHLNSACNKLPGPRC